MSRSDKEMMQKWEIVLMQARTCEMKLAGIVSLRSALEECYARVQATRSMRETLKASSRDATRRIKEIRAAGNEAAAGLRRLIESDPQIG